MSRAECKSMQWISTELNRFLTAYTLHYRQMNVPKQRRLKATPNTYGRES